MPSGAYPTYEYQPAFANQPAQLRSCSSRRSRLFAGGTYFRSRDLGGATNLIAVQMIEYDGPTASQPDAVVVVTNYQLNSAEMITGPASLEVYSMNLKWDDRISIKLDPLTNQPRAANYSISCKIGAPPGPQTSLGSISFSRLFNAPGKLAAKLTLEVPELTLADEIIISPRQRVYRLSTITKVDDTTMLSETGWDIDNLRQQINDNDPWIEMMPRSGVDPITGPNPISDAQDKEVDDKFLSPFPETRLGGGDGLPDNPDREITGPSRSIVHLNYSERYDGTLAETNTVLEWAGRSSVEGAWRSY